MMMGDTDVLRFVNHLRQCWPLGHERRLMGSFNISPPGDCNCHPNHYGSTVNNDNDSGNDFMTNQAFVRYLCLVIIISAKSKC